MGSFSLKVYRHTQNHRLAPLPQSLTHTLLLVSSLGKVEFSRLILTPQELWYAVWVSEVCFYPWPCALIYGIVISKRFFVETCDFLRCTGSTHLRLYFTPWLFIRVHGETSDGDVIRIKSVYYASTPKSIRSVLKKTKKNKTPLYAVSWSCC